MTIRELGICIRQLHQLSGKEAAAISAAPEDPARARRARSVAAPRLLALLTSALERPQRLDAERPQQRRPDLEEVRRL